MSTIANIQHDFSVGPASSEDFDLPVTLADDTLVSLTCEWLGGPSPDIIYGHSYHVWETTLVGGVVHVDTVSPNINGGDITFTPGIVPGIGGLPSKGIRITLGNTGGGTIKARLRAELLYFPTV